MRAISSFVDLTTITEMSYLKGMFHEHFSRRGGASIICRGRKCSLNCGTVLGKKKNEVPGSLSSIERNSMNSPQPFSRKKKSRPVLYAGGKGALKEGGAETE